MSSIVYEILELIKRNELLGACSLLEVRHKYEVAILTSRINDLNTSIRKDVIDYQTQQIEKNKIKDDILELVKSHEDTSHVEYRSLFQNSKEIFERNEIQEQDLLDEQKK